MAVMMHDEGRYTLYVAKLNGKTPKLSASHAQGLKAFSWTTLAEVEKRHAQMSAAYPGVTFLTGVNPCGVNDDQA